KGCGRGGARWEEGGPSVRPFRRDVKQPVPATPRDVEGGSGREYRDFAPAAPRRVRPLTQRSRDGELGRLPRIRKQAAPGNARQPPGAHVHAGGAGGG